MTMISWFRRRTRRGEGTPPAPHPPRPFIPPRLGVGGRRELVEPRLRHLVAECLCVGTDELRADVSLVDDLAADSLDLLEIAIAAEGDLGITIAERTLAGVRTYGELVAEVCRLVPDGRPEELPPAVWSRVIPAGADGGSLERAGLLTPYLAQTILEDALHAGPGARVELAIPAETGAAGLAAVEARFATLGARGVEVRVENDAPTRSRSASVSARGSSR